MFEHFIRKGNEMSNFNMINSIRTKLICSSIKDLTNILLSLIFTNVQ